MLFLFWLKILFFINPFRVFFIFRSIDLFHDSIPFPLKNRFLFRFRVFRTFFFIFSDFIPFRDLFSFHSAHSVFRVLVTALNLRHYGIFCTLRCPGYAWSIAATRNFRESSYHGVWTHEHQWTWTTPKPLRYTVPLVICTHCKIHRIQYVSFNLLTINVNYDSLHE